ncbi:hypothetical protein [Varibaculum vaginae]|uniref:hypothetical protein n=1 Tax=Varibaculum vaginae TaxID=2364797 RepID=UPI0011C4A040|nr:hypothetical protein [Varibaculum vaginae]
MRSYLRKTLLSLGYDCKKCPPLGGITVVRSRLLLTTLVASQMLPEFTVIKDGMGKELRAVMVRRRKQQ